MPETDPQPYISLVITAGGAECTGCWVSDEDLPVWVCSGMRTLLQAMRQRLMLCGASEAEAMQMTLNALRVALSEFVFSPDPEHGSGILWEKSNDEQEGEPDSA